MKTFTHACAASLITSSLVIGAVPAASQDREELPTTTLSATSAFAALKVRKPSLTVKLTDDSAPLKASLWAVHLLQESGDVVLPYNGRRESGFEMTGPFLERAAGIRVEFAF